MHLNKLTPLAYLVTIGIAPAAGPDDTQLVNQMASYMQTADYKSAEPLLRRILRMREEALGQDSPDTAIAWHNLGVCYAEMGRRSEAETAFRRALAITSKLRGSEAEAATAQHCLGSLYAALGRFSEAESLLRSALATRQKLVGPNDRSVALTLAELGELELNRGRPLTARSVLLRALAMAPDSRPH